MLVVLQDEQRPPETALKARQDGLGYSVAIKGAQRRVPCVGGVVVVVWGGSGGKKNITNK